MALPWGVKEEVDVNQVDAITSYMESASEIEVDGQKAKILKAGVKAKNDKATLIYRYQLV